MAEKKDGDDQVALEDVFKNLATTLTDAINASDEDESDDGAGDGDGGDGDGDGGDGDGGDGDGAGDDDQAEPISKAEAARRMKAFEKLVGKVEAIGKVLIDPEGDFQKALAELVGTVGTHGKVFEKVLERLETLESGTATKKSIDGDDNDADADGGEGKTPEEKAEVGLHKTITHLARHPGGAPAVVVSEDD